MTRVWHDKRYYERIETVEKFDHPSFLKINALSKQAIKILDVGCGDGSKLSKLGSKESKRYGCDISKAGTDRGKKLYKEIIFSVFSGTRLPFKSDFFDLTTTHFVLEHTKNPKALITDMIRVTKKDGLICFLAPNYGAPNRASPNFIGSRSKKLLHGFKHDLFPRQGLNWNKVTPKLNTMENFESDDDTTIEPYLNSLRLFLKSHKCDIVETSSNWNLELKNFSKVQGVFSFFGNLGFYPFKYWGPHLFIVARKL